MKKTRIDTQKLLNSFFDPNQASAIGSAFHCMDLAEEEIALAKSDYPVFEAQIHDAFRHLCPTEPLRRLSDDVYRHHCREIIQRIVNGVESSRTFRLGRGTSRKAESTVARVYYGHAFQLGPGAGPVGVTKKLVPFLKPKPTIMKSGKRFLKSYVAI